MDHTPIRGGFILLSRKLLQSGIMEKPPLYLKLWIWMLLQASHTDHGELKRGQLFTSLERMREAMKYRVGAALRRPTKKEVRTASDFLSKGTMIVTAKVTHGMVITIQNYDHYQKASNYERHNEGHSDGNDNGTILTRMINKNVKKNLLSEVAFEIATRLADLIASRNPKFKKPNLTAWSRHVDLMTRIDGRDPADIRAVVDWCQSNPFWQSNILSTEKLRKNFDQLYMKMNGNGNRPALAPEPVCPAHRPFDPSELERDE
jgi:hypothetical protein